MRLDSLSWLSGLAIAGLIRSVGAEEADATTYFDSIAVPPLLELTPSNWKQEIRKTKWLFVKYYSPYCPHCIHYAPTFQTVYEFYHTSKPAVEGATDLDFTKFYDFRFGVVNCIAYSDLCHDHGIRSFPTTVLHEDGEVEQSLKGSRNITFLSSIIEMALERTKPGSRPKTIDLPKAGDKESPKVGAGTKSEVQGESKEEKNGEKDVEKEKEKGKEKDGPLDEKKTPVAKVDKAAEQEKKTQAAPEASKDAAAREKPSTTYNQKGVSVDLNAETFKQLVTMTQEPWFIKFYAPWCPHCQDLAPAWAQLGKMMHGKLNIGEVNCDKETQLCKDAQAWAYPTILFYKGAERSEYSGLRGLGDLIQYAEQALDSSQGVADVDAETFKALEEKEEVIFVYFYDHATTSEDLRALEKLPLSLTGHAKMVKTKDPAMFERFKITTWPRLMVSREGRPTYYPPLTPNAMRDSNQVLDWMRSVWLPLVPELTVANARQLMEGKIVVLAVLNRDDQDAFQGGQREMKSAANEWMDRQVQEFQLERKKLRDAKQMRIEEAEDRDDQRALRAAKAIRIDMDASGRKEVAFAWVDGVVWQRWIRTTYGIDVKDGERVIINDEDRRRYWDNTVTGNYIIVSRTSILETLDKVIYKPQMLRPKLTVSYVQKIFIDLRSAFTEHIYLAIACFAALSYGLLSWFRARSRPRRGHFRLDSRNVRDFKPADIFGGPNGTKAD